MTTITAALVKELRDKTGAGMMDCKTALTENAGDMEAATEWLRKKGLSKAANKSGRIAANGLVGVISDGRRGAVVEVNSETDFVARNDQFQDIVRAITRIAPDAKGDLATLLASTYPGTSNTVDYQVKEAVATIGENLGVRRTAYVSVDDGVVADYLHNKAGDDVGKIGVLVGLESVGDSGKLYELGRQIAMHIAASSPLAVSADDLDPAAIEKERKFYTEQAEASGKPADIVAKMVEGRLKKEFIGQVTLLNQVYVLDGKATVAEALKAAEASVGAPVKVKSFVRYALGEGIEKKQEDFAAEVAKAAGAAAPKPAPLAAAPAVAEETKPVEKPAKKAPAKKASAPKKKK